MTSYMKFQVFFSIFGQLWCKMIAKRLMGIEKLLFMGHYNDLHLSWKFQLCSTYHSKIIDRKLAKFSENWKISQKTEKIVFVIALEFDKQSKPNFQNVFILVKVFNLKYFFVLTYNMTSFYDAIPFFSILANFGAILWLKW